MSGDRMIYLGTMQEVREKVRKDDHASTVSDLEKVILTELSGVPGDYQVYISSNRPEPEAA